MKGRSILGLVVSLAVLGAGSLAVLAQSQRYPTNAEIQGLIRDFPRVIQSNQDVLPSKPTGSEIQRLRSFVAAWSRVDSTIAPFLGQWDISEATLAIYPSNVRGRVCMILAGDWNDELGSVLTGSVSNNQIRASNRQVIVKQGDYLGILRVENNKPFIFPLGSPKPLESPTRFLELEGMQQLNAVITQQFNAAGCTASLPQSSQTASNRSPQISQNINQFNRFTIGTLSTGERVLRVPRQYMSQSPFKEALQRPLRPLRDNPDFYSQDWPGIFLWNGRTIQFTGIGVDSIAEFKAGNQTYWLTTINSLVSNSLEVSKPNFIDSREVRDFQDAYAAIRRKDPTQEGFFYVEARYGNGSGYPVITYLSDFRIAVTNPNQSVIVCEVSRYTYTGNGNSPTIENPNCRTAQQVLAQRSANSNSGQQMAAGRSQSSTPSLMRAANFQSVHGVTVEPAKEPTRDLAKLQRNYSFILDRINSRDLRDGTTVYSFDVYNTGYADGVIEVRNARGDLVEVRAIEGVRNPTNPIGFGIYSIKKEWESLTDFMNGRWFNDPRFATAQQKKTTIENIAIPPRGSLTFTKTGANAQAYNQATLIMGFFFGGWLSESEENPASLPGALNRILGEDATFKQKFFAALFLKLQENRIGSLVKEGAFQDLSSTLQAFTTGSWIEEENFSELVKTGRDVFLEEGIKYGITDRVLTEKLFGASIKTWVTAAEIFAKGGNVFLQNLDLERAKIAEQNNGPLAIVEPR